MGRPTSGHTHLQQEVIDLAPGGASAWGEITGTLANQTDVQAALDGKAASSHGHAQSDVTGLVSALAGKAETSHTHVKADVTDFSHTHAQSDVTNLVTDLAGKAAASHTHPAGDVPNVTSLNGFPGGTSTYLRADGTFATPAGGSDPWTYVRLAADFTTTSASAVDVTGLGFAPAANTRYEFEAMLMLRTATATVNARAGLAWPTGMTDGVAMIEESQTASAVPICANGNINAALLIAVGGLPNTTQSWPARIDGMVVAGATPSGNVRVQLASETAGTTVRVVANSFLRYRTVP